MSRIKTCHGVSCAAVQIPPEKLYELQPDRQNGSSAGSSVSPMSPIWLCFHINPISDLGADVAEVWNMKWSPEPGSMGITFEQLHENGMSAQVMLHFGYPLSGWQRLGLRSEHVTQEMARGFGLPLEEVQKILRDYVPNGSYQKVRP